MLGIYAPSVLHSAASFEIKLPSVRDFESRILADTHTYPWLACEYRDKIIGYAYATAYRDRVAYQWSCECSVYVDGNFKRRGTGSKLYLALLAILTYQGFINAYAVITYPNPASIKFHIAKGFKFFADYKKVGYKHGTWHDVHWYVKTLNTYSKRPSRPKAFSKIKEADVVKKILLKHNLD